eukprot:4961222-Prorocentrum_lima.AAC.1
MWDIPLQIPHHYGTQRVGRPRLHWVMCTLADAWSSACQLAQRQDLGVFDRSREDHKGILR